ncbi:MAG TPA: mechanosensitive ion channel protein MscS [Methylomirabilota bacterium]|nr:mechanosensitive ion channel protein MscS [Methylomirabilota bacterium]
MKRILASMVVLTLLTAVLLVPPPAHAGGRYGHGHGSGAGKFWGGLAVGAVTGLVFGGLFTPRVYAAPPPVVYAPAPIYVPPPPLYAPPPVAYGPVCTDYWVNPYWNGMGWAPGYWTRACR